MTWDTFWFVLATNLITLGLSTMYFITRIHELRVEHVEHIQQINADTMMQRQVYGRVSMEQLLGSEAFDADI